MNREEGEVRDNDAGTDKESLPEAVESGRRGRRQFVKGALATPVILTIVSRPAMGGNFCTPSGFLSGNLSNTQVTVCNGRDPASWLANLPSSDQSTSFMSVFGGVWKDQSGVPWGNGFNFKKILGFTDADDLYGFGRNATACYLNALYRDQLGYPMTVNQVVGIVQQILMYRSYKDSATGLMMNTQETVNFFKSTYI